MDGKALYLLAQFDEETQKTLAGYYEALVQRGFIGRQTPNIPYHLTLGRRPVSFEEALLEKLETVCAQTKRIQICLGHIGLFGLNVLFVQPNMNFELLRLQNSFFDHCGYGHHPWAAHATLLIDEPDVIMKALPIVAETFKPTNATIDSIGLYEFFPTRFIKKCGLLGK